MSADVLVPGAGGDAWYWQLVADRLRASAHEVIAVDLPAADEDAGLDAYADTIAAAAGDRSGVILVAQSLGAFSATMACERIDPATIVLVAPMIPSPGETPVRRHDHLLPRRAAGGGRGGVRARRAAPGSASKRT